MRKPNIKTIAVAALLSLGAAIVTTGCGATSAQVAARDKFMAQMKDNLDNDIGPKYKKYLDADTKKPQSIKDNDYGVLLDMSRGIARILSGNTAAVQS